MAQSVFAKAREQAWPYRFEGSIEVGILMAGIPADKNKAEGWLRSRMLDNPKDDDRLLQRAVAETMAELQISADEAIKRVNELRNLCAFKRDEAGLYIEGRQLKAALKEAVSVAVSTEKIQQKGWGATKKWISGFFPEHVFIEEQQLHLGATEPTGVEQQFIHSRFGSSIQYNEYVANATFNFTVVSDYEFSENDWAMIWTTGEMQGIGACRSQGYGVYKVTKWDQVSAKPAKTKSPKKAAQPTE